MAYLVQTQKSDPVLFALLAQLVRVPACHAGGQGFKSPTGRQSKRPGEYGSNVCK